MPFRPPKSKDECIAYDKNDPLAHWREAFYLRDRLIYLDGNSLGPLPRKARAITLDTLEHAWGDDLIASWNTAGWFSLPEQLGDMIAPVIGARAGEVIVSDTTSVNLYKAVMAALSLRPEARVIVSEESGFPTDLYILEGIMATGGGQAPYHRRLIGAGGAGLAPALDDNVAVVVLSHVDYRTGERLDMGAITRAVQAAGAIMIWDLCHSAGVMPVDVTAHNVDLAVGCSYKYLNGGPGAPAYLYCARRHLSALRQPLSGWWGHAQPFAFETAYRSDAGIRKFLCGTQPVLSLAAMQAGLEIARDCDLQAVREKAKNLTALFIDIVGERAASYGVGLASPLEAERRGAQVGLTFPHAHAVIQAMIVRDVVGDFRPPDLMRFGFAPLYLRYVDVWDAAHCLLSCLRDRVWRQTRYQSRPAIT